MKRGIIAALLAAAFLAGLGAQAADPAKLNGKLTVAAAANVATVGDALKAAFLAKYPNAQLDFVFGASGALTTQIQNGAPFQLFLSADLDFPRKLKAAGLTAGDPQTYAIGELILLSVKPLDYKKGLAVLKDPAVAQFAIANPEIAPYGKAAQEALTKAGLWDAVKAKAVTAQSIGQALQFTLGAAGVGFVNKSALYAKELAGYADKQGVNWFLVPAADYSPVEQGYVLLKTAADDPLAKAFAAFLAGPEAKKIFVGAGYRVP